MPAPESRWIEAISVLNELTQQGRLKWTLLSPMAEKKTVSSFFTSTSYGVAYQDKWFRLSRTETPFGSVPTYTLEIVTPKGEPLFKIPETSGLSDLLQSVQFQLSGVDSLLDSLLKEPRSKTPKAE